MRSKTGAIAVTAFTTGESTYTPEKEERRTFLRLGELKIFFDDWEAVRYLEGEVDDPGHAGYAGPYKHYLASLIARRKSQ